MSELERTVDAFAAELRGPRRARRRLVDEVAAHLHDSFEEELAAGTPPDVAARAVLDRFGDPRVPAAVWNRDRTARRGAERRNALVLALAAVAAAALAMTQHASGTTTRPAPARAAKAQPTMPPARRVRRRDDAPRVPGDLEDHECDREADERVGDRAAERDERSRSRRRRARRNRRRARGCRPRPAPGSQAAPAAQPHPGGELVADEADRPRSGERPEMGQVLRMDEPLDRLEERDRGGDEDREHDEEAGELLAAVASAGRTRHRAASR